MSARAVSISARRASGCGAHVREYAHLLEDDPDYAKKAARVTLLARDVGDAVAAEQAAQTGFACGDGGDDHSCQAGAVVPDDGTGKIQQTGKSNTAIRAGEVIDQRTGPGQDIGEDKKCDQGMGLDELTDRGAHGFSPFVVVKV